VLLRLAYLGVTNAFALLRLLPMSDRDKDVEILALRHQLTVLQRQLGTERVRFDPADRAFLAALLRRLPRTVLRRMRLLVRPDTVLRWHRDLLARWLLIWNGRHLQQVLAAYVEHYNTARPHRGINLRVPAADREPAPASLAQIRRIDRVDVLGGLIHEYRHAA
jgi:hypothetical protein